MNTIYPPTAAEAIPETRPVPAGAQDDHHGTTWGPTLPTAAAQIGTGHSCDHRPPCPPAAASDHDAARLVAYHPEQGWGLLCNGVIVFDDTGELLPNGASIPIHNDMFEPAAA